MEFFALLRIFSALLGIFVKVESAESCKIKEKRRDRHVYEHSYVRSLFDSIAHRYDLLNHTLSTGIDILWRRRAIRLLQRYQPRRILDVGTGTADFAIEAAWLNPHQIVGIDLSSQMLSVGKEKIRSRKLENLIELEIGFAEELRFESGSFDVVMSAFGVRNFENLESALKEFYRVLHDDGVALILEFSQPRVFPVKQLYALYSKYLLPILGGFISKNREAYEYLPRTVSEFPDGDEFCMILCNAGFSSATCYPQTFGIASIYFAAKKSIVQE